MPTDAATQPRQALPMATARALIVQSSQLGHFHCTVRCVQQMFLCGTDRTTGKNYEHRRQWIEQPISELADIFAVSIHSCAVMSHHLHLVLTVNPEHVANWDDWEIAQRGVALYRRAHENDDHRLARALVGLGERQMLDMSEAAYLESADLTGRQLHPGKRSRMQGSTLAVLKQIGLNEPQWLIQVRGIETRYWRAVGTANSLTRLAVRLGQKWMRGIVGAEALDRLG